MSIASRISAMEEHIGDVYDTLELGGADLTNVNKNIINISPTLEERYRNYMNNGTDDIWNNWNKVTGSGTDLTLNNTIEAPMKIDLKGNTSQFTTTGIQLFDGTTSVTNARISTSTGGSYGSSGYSISSYIEIESSTKYTLVTGIQSYYCWYDENKSYISGSAWNSGGNQTSPSNAKYIRVDFETSNINNVRFNKGTSTAYEPYTGGIPSPNPDYPQEVKVVKGDNKIKITGKNLISTTLYSGIGYNVSVDATRTISSFTDNYVEQLGNGKIRFKSPSSEWASFDLVSDILPQGNYRLRIYKEDGTTALTGGTTIYKCKKISETQYKNVGVVNIGQSWQNFNNLGASTININDDDLCVIISFSNNAVVNNGYVDLWCQLEKGTTATNYEPYTSEEHTISLGVENLWKPIPSETKNGITLDYNGDGSYTINGTATANTSFWLVVSYPAGTYTMSANNEKTINASNYMLVETSGGTADRQTLTMSIVNNTKTFTTTNTITTIVFVIGNGTTFDNFVICPQLEKGSVAHRFTKNGVPPIEMCNVDGKKDTFVIPSSKNYAKLEDASVKTTNSLTYETKGQVAIMYGTPSSGTNITLPFKSYTLEAGTYSFCVYRKTTSRIDISIREAITNSVISETNFGNVFQNLVSVRTFTLTETKKLGNIVVYIPASTTTYDNITFMIVKGSYTSSTIGDFEPSGTTELYKKQMIDEIILNGTENWQNYNTNMYLYIPTFELSYGQNDYIPTNYYSDHFTRNSLTNANNNLNASYLIQNVWGARDRQKGIAIKVNDTFTDVSTLKTWLSNNNTKIKYILEVPEYIEIKNQTLINELNAIKKSKSSQTNISQENDGLPFELDVSALESLN